MEKLVLTLAVGKNYEIMSNYTHPSIKSYAQRVDADFVSITESVCTSPHWEKFNKITEYLDEYERILYIDSDVLVREDAPDIFDVVPEKSLGLFNELPFTPQRNQSLYEACREHDIILKNWDNKYYNTGVMVVPRSFKELFKKPEKESCNFYEQGYFNATLAKYLETSDEKIFGLPYKFNRMTCMDQFTGEPRFSSYFMHYAGFPSLEFVLSLMERDLIRWKEDSPDYKYKRNILIDVTGGIGDQVCAEPAIRFLKENVYPDDNVIVKSHWPELFSHLNADIYKHTEFRPQIDTPYFSVRSLPEPETIMWTCVSNLLSHTVDFASMALLKRILPSKDKQIKLPPVKKGEIQSLKEKLNTEDLKNLVLVHAGRHWPSKTFPSNWWQSVIDGLSTDNLSVCIIGRDDGTRGTVNMNVDSSLIDTRDKLTLRELIVLTSQAKILISNDSAPIHIAGAFYNYIILIPTCKHPDHLLPFRKGNQSYKTVALYKKLMCYDYDSAPTHIGGSSADYVTGEWSDYLPEPEKVVNCVRKIFRR
jgi:ADP-heptose:LPS heptosyltransferase